MIGAVQLLMAISPIHDSGYAAPICGSRRMGARGDPATVVSGRGRVLGVGDFHFAGAASSGGCRGANIRLSVGSGRRHEHRRLTGECDSGNRGGRQAHQPVRVGAALLPAASGRAWHHPAAPVPRRRRQLPVGQRRIRAARHRCHHARPGLLAAAGSARQRAVRLWCQPSTTCWPPSGKAGWSWAKPVGWQ